MDLSTWILSPGDWLTRTWQGLPPGAPESPLAAVFGFLFWVLIVLIFWLAWSQRRSVARWVSGPGRQRVTMRRSVIGIGLAAALWTRLLVKRSMAWVSRWSWRGAWNVLWRAQAAHLILYVGVPLVTTLLKAALLILFLPFSVMGFGDSASTPGSLEPLRRPVCWTFVSNCTSPFARLGIYHPPASEACPPSETCGSRVVVYSDPIKVYFKVAWLLIAAAWIAKWHRGRAVRSGTPHR